jgi:hypothetical protein
MQGGLRLIGPCTIYAHDPHTHRGRDAPWEGSLKGGGRAEVDFIASMWLGWRSNRKACLWVFKLIHPSTMQRLHIVSENVME